MFPVKSVKNLKKKLPVFRAGAPWRRISAVRCWRSSAPLTRRRSPRPPWPRSTGRHENPGKPAATERHGVFDVCFFFEIFRGKKISRKFRNSDMIYLRYRASKHCQESVECVNLRIAILEVLKTGERVAVKARVGASSAHGI